MEPYYRLPSFEEVYLEDSWVRDINATNHYAEILVDTVLTEKNPQYTKPKPNEQYCYKNGKIFFSGPLKVKWIKKIMKPIPPYPGEEITYGNIDSFFYDKNCYKLKGSWGELEIISQEPPKFEFV